MSIEKNLKALLHKISVAARDSGRKAEELLLVAVSKGRAVEEIKEAYGAGCRDFGENRIQEALEKMEKAPSDIRWHFIGKLQKNKVNKAVGHFALIHSVDSPELAERLSRASEERGIKTAILLEANTSGEAAKSGLSAEGWEREFAEVVALKGIEVHGLMTMAPFTQEEEVIRHSFSELRLLRDRLQEIAKKRAQLSTLSMGMTHDYPIAIQEGATIIRIGTAIFDETC
ncbi:MAG: YggS family pyridoxal phosphate-dependent enzyme [Chlamydiales bacterium]|nr:YggS family pyridoxal phosphate-dependent enzyme [Chlamydiales bacterium]